MFSILTLSLSLFLPLFSSLSFSLPSSPSLPLLPLSLSTYLHVKRLERDQVDDLRVVPLLLELGDGLHDDVAHPRVAEDGDVLSGADDLGLLQGLAVVVRVGLSLDVVEQNVLEEDDLRLVGKGGGKKEKVSPGFFNLVRNEKKKKKNFFSLSLEKKGKNLQLTGLSDLIALLSSALALAAVEHATS